MFLKQLSSLGDGVVYPVRSQHQVGQYNSIGVTLTSLGDGVTFPQRSIDEDTDHLLGSRQRWSEEESPSHRGMLLNSDGTTDGEGARSSLMQVI